MKSMLGLDHGSFPSAEWLNDLILEESVGGEGVAWAHLIYMSGHLSRLAFFLFPPRPSFFLYGRLGEDLNSKEADTNGVGGRV